MTNNEDRLDQIDAMLESMDEAYDPCNRMITEAYGGEPINDDPLLQLIVAEIGAAETGDGDLPLAVWNGLDHLVTILTKVRDAVGRFC